MKGMRFKEMNGLLVALESPTMIGFGCPKCDDSELVFVTGDNMNKPPPTIIAFLRQHKDCGMLDTLEKRKDGQLYGTGKLDPKKPSQIVKF